MKETRNRDRFIKVAERAREFPPDKPEVREFIGFLKQHHTVLDPTMVRLKGSFVVIRPSLSRSRKCSAFSAAGRCGDSEWRTRSAERQRGRYREAFPAMLRLFKALYDAGSPHPGTGTARWLHAPS